MRRRKRVRRRRRVRKTILRKTQTTRVAATKAFANCAVSLMIDHTDPADSARRSALPASHRRVGAVAKPKLGVNPAAGRMDKHMAAADSVLPLVRPLTAGAEAAASAEAAAAAPLSRLRLLLLLPRRRRRRLPLRVLLRCLRRPLRPRFCASAAMRFMTDSSEAAASALVLAQTRFRAQAAAEARATRKQRRKFPPRRGRHRRDRGRRLPKRLRRLPEIAKTVVLSTTARTVRGDFARSPAVVPFQAAEAAAAAEERRRRR